MMATHITGDTCVSQSLRCLDYYLCYRYLTSCINMVFSSPSHTNLYWQNPGLTNETYQHSTGLIVFSKYLLILPVINFSCLSHIPDCCLPNTETLINSLWKHCFRLRFWECRDRLGSDLRELRHISNNQNLVQVESWVGSGVPNIAVLGTCRAIPGRLSERVVPLRWSSC